MDQLEVIFEEFRESMNQLMLDEGIEPTVEEKIKFYKDMVEFFKDSDETPVLVKRMMIVIVEYEIELLETTPIQQ